MVKFLAILVFLALIFGFIVPKFALSETFAMERTATLEAPASALSAKVSDLRSWAAWTVWNKEEDPTLEWTYEGEAGTVGHSMAWTAEELGNGKLVLTEVSDEVVAYDFTFEGMAPAQGRITFDPAGDGKTNVGWNFSGAFEGNPAWRWFGLAMPMVMGPQFDKCLEGLGKEVAGAAAEEAPADPADPAAPAGEEGE